MPDPLASLAVGLAVLAVLVLVFRPDHGLYARWKRGGRLSSRVLAEDALKHIHKQQMRGLAATLSTLAGTLGINLNQAADLVGRMERDGLVVAGQSLSLSPEGRAAALHIIRAHRLWERYLAEETGYGEQEWHDQAERREHRLTPQAAESLAASLGHPSHDPHGDPIPSRRGGPVVIPATPLGDLAAGEAGRVVHVEDEPGVVYAQLVAQGIHAGMVITMIESSPERVRFWAAGDEHVLAPMLAANVSVLRQRQNTEEVQGSTPLSVLPLGERATVVGISHACRGAERRRFLDLGLVPGTVVAAEMRSPTGDPTAYRIRETLIALRRAQAEQIRVRAEHEASEGM